MLPLNLTVPVVDHSPAAAVSPDVTECEVASVAQALGGVVDSRQARGIRHRGFGLLMGTMAALLAGARTTVEIAEHIQDLTDTQRARIGLTWKTAPSLSTVRRFLKVADPQVLQAALTAWAEAHAARVAAVVKGLRHFAVDGKSLRGAAGKGCPKPHVLGVLDVTAEVFLTQRQINAADPTSACSPRSWTRSARWTGSWSARTRCTPRPGTPPTWTHAARACWWG